MSHKPIPQLAPAMALVQLISEHPGLPPLSWSLSRSGWLSGAYYPEDADPRPVMAAYVKVLGGVVQESRYADDAHRRFSVILNAAWRDVDFYLSMGCPLPVVLAGELAEQRHQLLDPAEPPLACAAPEPAAAVAA